MLSQIAPADFLALKYPLAAEIKYDGVRCIALVNLGKVRLYSRNGKYLENFEEVREKLAEMPEGVYDGEIISPDGFQALMKRTHAKQGTNTDVKIEYKIFDKLTVDEWVTGGTQREYQHRCKDVGERVIIKNPVHLDVYYNYVLKSGHEGLILKEINSPYENGSSRYWYKLKPKDTIDMKILAYENGLGKHEGTVGAISCIADVGKAVVHAYVGTGFTDEDRAYIDAHRKELLGKFVEVEFQEMTKPDRYGSMSLIFPVFKCLRLDK